MSHSFYTSIAIIFETIILKQINKISDSESNSKDTKSETKMNKPNLAEICHSRDCYEQKLQFNHPPVTDAFYFHCCCGSAAATSGAFC